METNTSKNLTENQMNALLNILSCSKIDMGEMLDNIESMGNKKILEQHTYKITENKDGRFSTYVPDETKPNHRRKIVKPSRELLEKEIIKFYREREKEKSHSEICLRNFYEEWLAYKSLHTNSSAYLKTIDELWKRYYINDPIIDIPFLKLDMYKLDTWAHALIKEKKLTKKQYYNMSIIMRQSLQLAVSKGILYDNPFSKVKIKTKLFRPVRKKPDETQVYLLDEQPLVEKESYADFKRLDFTAPLAVPFAFQTGLRVSELAALEWSDIEEECFLHVQRSEIREFERHADGTWGRETYTIRESTKTFAGNRRVYLTSTARDILRAVKEHNTSQGYGHCEYIFLKNGRRATARDLNTILRRCCMNANISEKGMHKIRKSFISTLIDTGEININFIREQVGHTDERTTYGNYCYNRKSPVQTAQAMEQALAHNI